MKIDAGIWDVEMYREIEAQCLCEMHLETDEVYDGQRLPSTS
jgi:hypothetical protein